REHHLEQPELADVARQVHLSEFHFQRLFSRWAGISPKRFLQFLTLHHAKKLLADSKPLLEASFDSGLSGPSRLHDLFVTIEGVTPGEFKGRGAGLEIRYGIHPTCFGDCLLATTPRGVCWLSFVTDGAEERALTELRDHWAGATLSADPSASERVADRIFSRRPNPTRTSLNLLVAGTNWQIKVWEALLRIPPGAVTTYRQIAARLGRDTAARAVGNAVARNPIAYLIPCHRVIRQSGVIGDYRWGTDRKRAMLGWESARKSGQERVPASDC
ncbi:MAG: methylated-DNA--[protein]-cysteine S-methyltransferase, partial [Verrucomicrobia bacterium]|nr:methylated-DNA--[protein]-cysteine S-methyltransferase [Verrucomicrobiota bacterium]